MSDSDIDLTAFWYAQLWCSSLFLASFYAWLRLSVFHSEQLLLATVLGALAGPFLLTAAAMWNLRSHQERKGASLSAFGYFILANIHFGAYLDFKGFAVSDGMFLCWVASCFALSAAMDFCLEQTWTPFTLLTGMWRTERIRHNALEESMHPWAIVARWRGKQDMLAQEVDVLADKQSVLPLWGDTKWNGGVDKSLV